MNRKATDSERSEERRREWGERNEKEERLDSGVKRNGWWGSEVTIGTERRRISLLNNTMQINRIGTIQKILH